MNPARVCPPQDFPQPWDQWAGSDLPDDALRCDVCSAGPRNLTVWTLEGDPVRVRCQDHL